MQIINSSIQFVLFVFAQALVFNQLEIDYGIQFMIYPLYILLLPYDLNVILSMLIAFAFGLSIDAISNTFGLHASSALIIAYLRPYFFKMFEIRDGYDPSMVLSTKNMELRWIISVHGLLILIHHFWFFLIEIFKFNEIMFVFQKTLFSFPLSLIICILIQSIFYSITRQR